MTKPCPICGEPHGPERTLSFDGCGINSCGQYRDRIATLHRSTMTDDEIKHLGPLFVAAPRLLEAAEHALREVEGFQKRTGVTQFAAWIAETKKAIREATGQ